MLCEILDWFYTPPNIDEPHKATFFKDNCKIDLIQDNKNSNIITVLETVFNKTNKVGIIDTEHKLIDSKVLDLILSLGVKEDKITNVREYARKEFKETCTLTITTNKYCYPYSLRITGPIEKVIPLDYNYYYFLNSHLTKHPDQLIISSGLTLSDTLMILKYLKNGGSVDEIVKAYALSNPLAYLTQKDKLTLLKNQIDNLLNLLLEEGINKFSRFYIFKLDSTFIVTTNCTNDYYILQNEKIFRRGKEITKKTFIKTLKNLLNWSVNVTPVIAKRLKELKEHYKLNINLHLY